MSQPSLSAAIHKLEEELGGALFDRNSRSLKLTPFGESMRTHLSRIEHARESANHAASDFIREKPSVINLGIMCTLSTRRLASAIATFGLEPSNNELITHDVWESQALKILLSGALDCLIMAHSCDLPTRYEVQLLADEPMVLAMHKSHPLAEKESIDLADLQGMHYVDRLRCEFRELFYKELNTRQLSVHTVLRSEREDLVAEAISRKVGVSIMPKSAADNVGLKSCAVRDVPVVRRISMVTVKDRFLEPSVHQFFGHVVSAYGID